MAAPVDPKNQVIHTVVGAAAPAPTESSQNQYTEAGQVLDDAGVDIRSLFAPPQTDGELGRLGHFRILKKLGAGGMGMVLLAEDMNLERPVALKIMLPRFAASSDAKERFLREAKAAAKISHDNVVTIHHVGEDRGIPFIAMELLKGASLDDYLKEKKAVSIVSAMRIVREVAEGLQAAHKKGLIHRDIKPANIWLEAPKGRVKILDFGLARASEDQVKLTHSGAVIGTPAYMSPEQAAGEKTDERTDLFSLGVVLYELTAGRLPFLAANVLATLHALKYEPHPSIATLNPQAPVGLVKLIDRLLAKQPEDRPKSANEVVLQLKDLEKPELRPDGKPIPEVVFVPMNTSRDSNPFANIDETQTVSRGAKSSERNAGRTESRKRPEPSNPDREEKKLNRWLIPASVAGAALVLIALLVIVLLPGKKPSVTEPEVKKPESPKVVYVPKTEPPKKAIDIEPKKKEDPIVEKKIPLVDDKLINVDLGGGVKLELVKITAKGKKFLMGSPKEEAERNPFEANFDAEEQHEVAFNHDFYLGKYEVTQEQYEVLMGANPSKFKGAKNPVETVSWDDAQEYIKKLNTKFKERKLTFRLPSEAEWEYACRAGTTTPFHFGKELNGKQANCNGNYPYGTTVKGPYLAKTISVGTFAPNDFGLYDMHGNVWEWCEDYYGEYKSAPKDGTAQSVKQSNDVRVLRGGSWGNYSGNCRSAYRGCNAPDVRINLNGFRVVVSLP